MYGACNASIPVHGILIYTQLMFIRKTWNNVKKIKITLIVNFYYRINYSVVYALTTLIFMNISMISADIATEAQSRVHWLHQHTHLMFCTRFALLWLASCGFQQDTTAVCSLSVDVGLTEHFTLLQYPRSVSGHSAVSCMAGAKPNTSLQVQGQGLSSLVARMRIKNNHEENEVKQKEVVVKLTEWIRLS